MARDKTAKIPTSYRKGEKITDRVSPCRPCGGRGWNNEKNPKTGFTRSVICTACSGNGYIRSR